MKTCFTLWRGDLSPFGGEAVAKPVYHIAWMKAGAASQPNGDKSPRHKI
jgi:hypothetical protein